MSTKITQGTEVAGNLIIAVSDLHVAPCLVHVHVHLYNLHYSGYIYSYNIIDPSASSPDFGFEIYMYSQEGKVTT